MKKLFYSLALLSIIIFNVSAMAGGINNINSKDDFDAIMKTVKSLPYSPLVVDKHLPETLIQNWITVNNILKQMENQQCVDELAFLKNQAKRFLNNIDSYARRDQVSESVASDREYVAFSQVCFIEREISPKQVADKYKIYESVLARHLNNK